MSQLSPEFQTQLLDLMRWQRAMCRFRRKPVSEAVFPHCLDAFCMIPSVGLSEPKPSEMRKAPLQLAVFCEENTVKGAATPPIAKRAATLTLMKC